MSAFLAMKSVLFDIPNPYYKRLGIDLSELEHDITGTDFGVPGTTLEKALLQVPGHPLFWKSTPVPVELRLDTSAKLTLQPMPEQANSTAVGTRIPNERIAVPGFWYDLARKLSAQRPERTGYEVLAAAGGEQIYASLDSRQISALNGACRAMLASALAAYHADGALEITCLPIPESNQTPWQIKIAQTDGRIHEKVADFIAEIFKYFTMRLGAAGKFKAEEIFQNFNQKLPPYDPNNVNFLADFIQYSLRELALRAEPEMPFEKDFFDSLHIPNLRLINELVSHEGSREVHSGGDSYTEYKNPKYKDVIADMTISERRLAFSSLVQQFINFAMAPNPDFSMFRSSYYHGIFYNHKTSH